MIASVIFVLGIAAASPSPSASLTEIDWGALTPTPTPAWSAEDAVVMQQPTSFVVSASNATLAWGRAQSFVARYCNMKIQVISDYVIETYGPQAAPVDLRCHFGMQVIKTPGPGGQVQLDVGAETNGVCSDNLASRVSHAAAFYIATGRYATWLNRPLN